MMLRNPCSGVFNRQLYNIQLSSSCFQDYVAYCGEFQSIAQQIENDLANAVRVWANTFTDFET